MTYKFGIGATINIKNGNPGDPKRFPEYIKGKKGVIHAARGPFKNPRDHLDERPPIYLVEIDRKQIDPSAKDNETIMVDVFEDWIVDEEVQ
ncbi:MAG: SH3-like domain-containing protein [Nitrososphaerales archaeon]